jgi:peptide/nickel transport system permease protein
VVRYIIRRLLWAVMLFFAVTVVSYILFFIIPADPAKQFAGKGANADTIAKAKHFLGLDKPSTSSTALRLAARLPPRPRVLLVQPRGRQPHHSGRRAGHRVTRIRRRVLLAPVAIPIGILSALRPRSLLDRAAMTFVLIGISAHPLWIGLIFAYFIGYKWHITPITNYADFFNPPPGQPGGPVQWAYHLVLPWMTFMILFAALYVRMIRANVIETLNEDYVRTARAKGAPSTSSCAGTCSGTRCSRS